MLVLKLIFVGNVILALTGLSGTVESDTKVGGETATESQTDGRTGETTIKPNGTSRETDVTEAVSHSTTTEMSVSSTGTSMRDNSTVEPDTDSTPSQTDREPSSMVPTDLTTDSRTGRTDAASTTFRWEFTDSAWIHSFIMIHHFAGTYIYDGGEYIFDFLVSYISPQDSNTLVATFYDEDGAVLEMNGTSDGRYVKFVLSKLFAPAFRFPVGMAMTLLGVLHEDGYSSVYSGNFTKPLNSSFETFNMKMAPVKKESGDVASTKLAMIIAVPTSIAFVGVLATVGIVCWATKKGFLNRHKSYRVFSNSVVTYDTEQETIHI